MIKVVCGIIRQEDKIFICRRRKGKSLAGYWEFPGGKIEDGEKPEESLVRELMEELGMEVHVGQFLGSSQHDYGSFKIELMAYECVLLAYNGVLTDHDRFEWVSLVEVGKFNFAPADVPLLQLIL